MTTDTCFRETTHDALDGCEMLLYKQTASAFVTRVLPALAEITVVGGSFTSKAFALREKY